MYVKKIKRKCGVRGCRNTDSYAISMSREMGNSIIACRECLVEALAVIEETNKPLEFKEATPVEAPTEPTETISDEDKANTPIEEATPVNAPRKRQRKTT